MAAEAASEGLGELARVHRARSGLSLESEERLRASLPAPLVRVPRLYVPQFGRSAVEQCLAHLQPLLGGRP